MEINHDRKMCAYEFIALALGKKRICQTHTANFMQ